MAFKITPEVHPKDCLEELQSLEKNKDRNKFTIKGEARFIVKNGEICCSIVDFDNIEIPYRELYRKDYDIYDLMSGKQFADCVEAGGFIDYDGSLAEIFVNGYKSNLGIYDFGIHQGEFCVALPDFRKLCDKYDIKVNWANK